MLKQMKKIQLWKIFLRKQMDKINKVIESPAINLTKNQSLEEAMR